jgi:hypothetical protein
MQRALAAVRQGAALAAAAGAVWVAFGPATAVMLAWNTLAVWLAGR